MNVKRLAMGAVAGWVVSLGVSYLVNEVILKGLYSANASAFRPEAEMMANLPYGFAFTFVGMFVFAYAYAKGYEGGSGIGEGIRFGGVVGLLLSLLAINWIWATMPISFTLAGAMMIDNIVEFVIYGAIVGAIYKKA